MPAEILFSGTFSDRPVEEGISFHRWRAENKQLSTTKTARITFIFKVVDL